MSYPFRSRCPSYIVYRNHFSRPLTTFQSFVPPLLRAMGSSNSSPRNWFSFHPALSISPLPGTLKAIWYVPRLHYHIPRNAHLHHFQGRAFPLYPSKAFSSPTHQEKTIRWFQSIYPILAVLSGVLKIVHPEQYALGMSLLEELPQHPQHLSNPEFMLDLLARWALPFSGMAVLVNRSTAAHRDKGGFSTFFDLCTTFGHYSSVPFKLPQVRTTLSYSPGCSIILLAKIFIHEVPAIPADRVALILFTKDHIAETLKLSPCGWPAPVQLS